MAHAELLKPFIGKIIRRLIQFSRPPPQAQVRTLQEKRVSELHVNVDQMKAGRLPVSFLVMCSFARLSVPAKTAQATCDRSSHPKARSATNDAKSLATALIPVASLPSRKRYGKSAAVTFSDNQRTCCKSTGLGGWGPSIPSPAPPLHLFKPFHAGSSHKTEQS